MPLSSNKPPKDKQDNANSNKNMDLLLIRQVWKMQNLPFPLQIVQIASQVCSPICKTQSQIIQTLVSPRYKRSYKQEIELAAYPKITENAKSAVPKAVPSRISKPKSGHLFGTNSPKSLAMFCFTVTQTVPRATESGKSTYPPIG
ncbi:hypothetical protein H6P81_012294 [Aristolochia fimbriata]|uniref:Uncharacterized protein n=1 Tax=Aristolochia fimbriata TaxID=158543 RepID=A0AAV7ECP7_ARIFI|nr:hypothetical protein H6P81_012294 [Aristolochia fimbriata]